MSTARLTSWQQRQVNRYRRGLIHDLIAVEGLAVEDVAEQLGLTVASVRRDLAVMPMTPQLAGALRHDRPSVRTEGNVIPFPARRKRRAGAS